MDWVVLSFAASCFWFNPPFALTNWWSFVKVLQEVSWGCRCFCWILEGLGLVL